MRRERHDDSLGNQLAILLTEIDDLTDRVKHPELQETDEVDRLEALLDLASGIVMPNLKLIKNVGLIKDRILGNFDPYKDNEYFKKMLIDLKNENESNFRISIRTNKPKNSPHQSQ